VTVHSRTVPATLFKNEITLKNGARIAPAILGVGIGIGRTLENFGRVKKESGIITNEFLETSEENVWAAGDSAEFFDTTAGITRTIGNWTNSFLQGRSAAANMFAAFTGDGEKMPFRAVSTYNIVNLGMNLTYVGYLDDADDYWEQETGGGILRAYLARGVLRGGVLINRFDDKIKLATLVETGEAKKYELEQTFPQTS